MWSYARHAEPEPGWQKEVSSVAFTGIDDERADEEGGAVALAGGAGAGAEVGAGAGAGAGAESKMRLRCFSLASSERSSRFTISRICDRWGLGFSFTIMANSGL